MSDKIIDFSPGSQARKFVQIEFESEKWKLFRKWFLESYDSVELKTLSNEFYKSCDHKNRILFFVPWFVSTYVEKYISTLERNYKLGIGKNITQVYPPQQPFQIEKNGSNHSFVAFTRLLEDDTLPATCKQINMMFKHNNYSNLYLDVLREQMSSLHDRVEQSVITEKPVENTTSKTIRMANPNLQPPPIITNFKLKQMKDLEDFLEDKLKQEGENMVEDVVYTLIVCILEHFTRKYSDNGESIRTLLQNLRCKTLLHGIKILF